MNNLLLQLNNNQLRRFKKMNNVLNINKIIILNNNTPPKTSIKLFILIIK